MASKERVNYSGLLEPPVQDIVDTYVRCNFSQPAAITDPETGKKVGVPIFPESREVPREFFNCNLNNCYVYSDHISDLPALELVKYPVVVSGRDRHLEAIARDSAWHII